tara:strand:+ start:153 stop:506 length:354 start_codon:yes stop_codon:yes gene_type:complete
VIAEVVRPSAGRPIALIGKPSAHHAETTARKGTEVEMPLTYEEALTQGLSIIGEAPERMPSLSHMSQRKSETAEEFLSRFVLSGEGPGFIGKRVGRAELQRIMGGVILSEAHPTRDS